MSNTTPFTIFETILSKDKIGDGLRPNFVQTPVNDLEKKISPSSRNLRLSAIRSFFRYISYKLPESSALISQVLAIPYKKTSKKLINFLSNEEVAALLKAPNQWTWIGRRDHALIAIALQTGLRLSELTNLTWNNVHLNTGAYIRCLGKGRKERCTPLTRQSVEILRLWLKESRVMPGNYVFPSSNGRSMSSDSVQYLLKKYHNIAQKSCASLKNKGISPHILRHTAAMQLFNAGIDRSVIALWLGHESIETTQIYD